MSRRLRRPRTGWEQLSDGPFHGHRHRARRNGTAVARAGTSGVAAVSDGADAAARPFGIRARVYRRGRRWLHQSAMGHGQFMDRAG